MSRVAYWEHGDAIRRKCRRQHRWYWIAWLHRRWWLAREWVGWVVIDLGARIAGECEEEER